LDWFHFNMKFELDLDRRNISDEMILKDISAVAVRLATGSPTADEYAKHGRFHPSTAIRRFRGWRAALVKAGLKPVHHNGGIDPDTALADLRAVASRLGRPTVSNKAYLANGQFTDAPLLRAFGSWNAALKAAGLEPTKRAKIPTEELFENLERMWRTLGRQPKYGEVEKPFSSFGAGTYESRFGSWRKALEAFVAYVGGEQAALVEPSVESLAPSPSASVSTRRTSRNVNWRLRFLVLQRDDFRCVKCGASPAKGHVVSLHVDHVVPWSKGGETEFTNLQTLCETCNIGKSDVEPPGA
jgi:hypothetical protein